jgi:hypothetical protein
MNRYLIEFKIAGEKDTREWTVEAADEDTARRVVDYEFPNHEIFFVSVDKLGDCA